MNITKQIEKMDITVSSAKTSYHGNPDFEAVYEIKQLIKEVLEYVKPKTGAYGQEITPTEDLVLDADHCAQCYLGHMEAKQKELGL